MVEIRWIRVAHGMCFVHYNSICGQSLVDPKMFIDVVFVNHIEINIYFRFTSKIMLSFALVLRPFLLV